MSEESGLWLGGPVQGKAVSRRLYIDSSDVQGKPTGFYMGHLHDFTLDLLSSC